MMPKIEGFVRYEKIKADRRTATIPNVLMTAFDDENAKTRGIALQAVDYITKHFNAAEVKVYKPIWSSKKPGYLALDTVYCGQSKSQFVADCSKKDNLSQKYEDLR